VGRLFKLKFGFVRAGGRDGGGQGNHWTGAVITYLPPGRRGATCYCLDSPENRGLQTHTYQHFICMWITELYRR